MLVTAAIGAVVGGIVGGAISYAKTGQVSWKAVAVGAVAGGLIGLGAGAAAGVVLAGSATATTGAVVAGANTFVATVGAGGLTAGGKLLLDNAQKANTIINQTSSQIIQRFSSAGYSTFNKLKDAIGDAGKGYQWHHIVEQYQITKSGFASTVINSTGNIIRVSDAIHAKISGYYNTTSFTFTNGQSVRNWLAGQDFKTQYEFGLNVFRKFGVIQ